MPHKCKEFRLNECDEDYDRIKAANLAAAMKIAKKNFDENNYDVDKTMYIPIRVYCTDENCRESDACEMTIEPKEPKCTQAKHEYKEISLRGVGAGTVSQDKCTHCGLIHEHNTWDQSYGYEPRTSDRYYFENAKDEDEDEYDIERDDYDV